MDSTFVGARFFLAVVGTSGFGGRIRTDDADELVRQVGRRRSGVVNALCQAGQIVVVARARNNAAVRLPAGVQTLEMKMVVCQDRAAIRRGIGKHDRIGRTSTSRFLYGKHVMPQATQDQNGTPREVLIGV
jgi:hypothetical protein